VRENATAWLRLSVASAALAAVFSPHAAPSQARNPAGGACSADSPAPLVSMRPGAGSTLVPAGAQGVLLCSYRGLNPPGQPHRLIAERTLTDPSEVAALTGQFDALRAAPPLVACPMNDGSEIVATFLYRQAPPDAVAVGLSGCEIVSNGHVSRTGSLPPGPALLGRLTGLIRTAR
jgi:hypothetical protein